MWTRERPDHDQRSTENSGLTRRERDILRLMADDLSNAEIAERLVVSPGTVKWYAKQIYSKLGVHTRDEAIAAMPRLADDDAAPESRHEPEIPHNLPALMTPLIGRQSVIDQLCRQLRDERVRLLTLLGTPGIGKTRLSLEVGTRLLRDFPDGVYFFGLAPLTDVGLISELIFQTLGIQAETGEHFEATLRRVLQRKRLLLIFDNFEHLLAGAPLITDLLSAAPNVKVLATSREPLRLYGEVEFDVPQLTLPEKMAYDDLMQSEAVRLFVQRAQAAKNDFALTEDNAVTVGQICMQLDGLPLAIELAAARIRLYTPHALLGRLSKRLSALTGGSRDLAPRHQTLRSAIGWSYELLSTQEQAVFRRLGIFSGVFGLAAAEAICAEIATDVIDVLESLATKSLIKVSPQEADLPYFYLLETVREYALDQLSETGEYEAVRAAHAAHYTQVSEHLCTSNFNDDVFGAASIELENFRSALHFYQAETTITDDAVWLAANVIYLSSRIGQQLSAMKIGEAMLQRDTSSVSIQARALLMGFYGLVLMGAGDTERGRSCLHEAATLMMQPQIPRDFLYMHLVGLYAGNIFEPRPAESISILEELIAHCAQYSDPALNHRAVGMKLDLAFGYDCTNQHDKAVALRQELLPVARSDSSASLLSSLCWDIASDLIHEERYNEALPIIKEGLAAATRSRRSRARLITLYFLLIVQVKLHLLAEAEFTYAELQGAYGQFDKPAIIESYMADAQFAMAMVQRDYAAALAGLHIYSGQTYPDYNLNPIHDWLSRALDLALITLPPEQAARIYGRWVEHIEHSPASMTYRLTVPFNLNRRRRLEDALGEEAFAAAAQSGIGLTSAEILAMFDAPEQND